MKNIVVLSTSLRNNSNSAKLAEAFADGAEAAGHAVERISLKNKEMHFCIGALSARKPENVSLPMTCRRLPRRSETPTSWYLPHRSIITK